MARDLAITIKRAIEHPLPCGAFVGEPNIFEADKFCNGKAIMEFAETNLFPRRHVFGIATDVRTSCSDVRDRISAAISSIGLITKKASYYRQNGYIDA